MMKTTMALLIVFATVLSVGAPSPSQASCEECYFVDIGLGGEPLATCLDLVPGGYAGCVAFGGAVGEGCLLIILCRRGFPVS